MVTFPRLSASWGSLKAVNSRALPYRFTKHGPNVGRKPRLSSTAAKNDNGSSPKRKAARGEKLRKLMKRMKWIEGISSEAKGENEAASGLIGKRRLENKMANGGVERMAGRTAGVDGPWSQGV